MAGAGYKDFVNGDVLSATQVDTYLMEQSTMVFATTGDRDTALATAKSEGMLTYISATNQVQLYQNATWRTVYGAMPYLEMDRSTAQSIANNTTTTLTGFTTTTGRNNTEALSYSNGVWTVLTGQSGIYSFTAYGEFTANATGRRRFVLKRNAADISGLNISAPSAGNGTMSASITLYLAAGDTLSITVLQTSGAALDFNNAKSLIAKVSI